MKEIMMWATDAEKRDYFRKVEAPDCKNCGTNPCSFQCFNSPNYYSPEREREDSLFEDSLSHNQWFAMAVAQYEQVHGEPYVS